MKCLLVSPPPADAESLKRLFPPMSLLYLAASLRKFRHEPIVFDLATLPDNSEEELVTAVMEKIAGADIRLLGITCLISSSFPFIRKLTEKIKRFYPDLKIVIGGMHPTIFAKEILHHCHDIDYIAIGEAEESFVTLCSLIENGDNIDVVPGFTHRNKHGQIVTGERLPFVKRLDDLPMPSWQDISINNYQFDYSNWYNPKKHKINIVAPILTSRSCPFDCNFCAFNTLMGRGFRYHSPKRVVDELEFLYKEYGVNYFEFIDDNLAIKKTRIIEICNEIIKRNLDIQFTSLSGLHVSTIDKDVVDALHKAGFLHAIIPVEHGSEFIRNEIIGKRTSREKIFEVTRLFQDKGIMTRGFFIIGFPEETRETIRETVQMIHELNLDLINVFNLIPFPGTKVFQQCLEQGLFLNNVDIDTLWNGEFTLDTTDSNGFYLKPSSMSMDELLECRLEIDELIKSKHQKTQMIIMSS